MKIVQKLKARGWQVMMKKSFILMIATTLIFVTACFSDSNEKVVPVPNKKEIIDKKFISFDDGDTFHIGEEYIRILGIDCPEIKHPKHGIFKDQPYGVEAANFTKNAILKAKKVEIERYKKDFYRRTLAHITLDGELLAIKLLKAGLAYESVTHYGHQGFPEYGEKIKNAARIGPKPKFIPPYKWRRKFQKKKKRHKK